MGAFRENRIPDEPAAALRAIDGAARNQDSRAVEAPVRFAGRKEAPTSRPPPRAELAACRDGAAACGESGSAGAFDGPDSHGEYAAGKRHRGSSTPSMLRSPRWQRNALRFRKASAAPLRRLASQPDCSSVIRHIGFVEQKVRSLAARSKRAQSAATTQRLEHTTVGGTAPAGRMECSNGPGGRPV